MIDKTHLEELALAAALPFLGEIATEIGMEKHLAEYTREEALTLIEVVVSAYQKYKFENSPVQTPITQPQPKGVSLNASNYA